ncbi:hypothetical protein CRYUN_Cryun05aG0122500 [Craigia yunnanensis]
MAESKSICGQHNKLDDMCQKQNKPQQENSPGYPAGGRKTKCCPTTTEKGDGGFMNMLCKALGCCGLLSACYDPRTSQFKG